MGFRGLVGPDKSQSRYLVREMEVNIEGRVIEISKKAFTLVRINLEVRMPWNKTRITLQTACG